MDPADGFGGISDSIQFAYTPLVGDGTIVARWTGAQQQNGSTRYGVMIREGPTPTAAMAFLDIVGAQNFVRYENAWRITLA